MGAKSLKISQILRAHMPYFCRPGHKCIMHTLACMQAGGHLFHNILYQPTSNNSFLAKYKVQTYLMQKFKASYNIVIPCVCIF